MAAAWLKLEAYDIAEHCAQRALVLGLTFMKARYRRGLARKGSLQLYAATLDFEALLEQDPDSTEAKKAFDETLTLMNERDEDDGFVAFDQEFPSPSEKRDAYNNSGGGEARFGGRGGMRRGGWHSGLDLDDFKDSQEERMNNFGFTEDELQELICQGVKPWDDDAWDVLDAIYSL
ncbi:hypothetical protein EDB87DRAFT_1684526 [Lactarius vividus]|nr:hypothetical protein EDB87DRAFT_1684526 [Lactarius vividus]